VVVADQSVCPIHGVAECFRPAQDAFVRQAYEGYCTRIDWPFVRVIPRGWKPGTSLEALLELQAAARSQAQAAAAEAGREGPRRVCRVEFYYSSQDEPAKQYHCDIPKVLALCEQLKGKGVAVLVQDCAAVPVSFATYNAAVTGPSVAKRAVFGMKGALQEDMGKAAPALLVFAKEGDRHPDEVFPRSDKELGRLLGVEEALQQLLGAATA